MSNVGMKNWGRDTMWGNFGVFFEDMLPEIYLEEPKWIRELSTVQKKKYSPLLKRFLEKDNKEEIIVKGQRVPTRIPREVVEKGIKENKAVEDILKGYSFYSVYGGGKAKQGKVGNATMLKQSLEKAIKNELKVEVNGKITDSKESNDFKYVGNEKNFNIIVSVSKELYGKKAQNILGGFTNDSYKQFFERFLLFAGALKTVIGGYKYNISEIAAVIFDPHVIKDLATGDEFDVEKYKTKFIKEEQVFITQKTSIIDRKGSSKKAAGKAEKPAIEKEKSKIQLDKYKKAIEDTIEIFKTISQAVSVKQDDTSKFFDKQGILKRAPIVIAESDPVGPIGDYLKTILSKHWNDLGNMKEYLGIIVKDDLEKIVEKFTKNGNIIKKLVPWTEEEIDKILDNTVTFNQYFVKVIKALYAKRKRGVEREGVLLEMEDDIDPSSQPLPSIEEDLAAAGTGSNSFTTKPTNNTNKIDKVNLERSITKSLTDFKDFIVSKKFLSERIINGNSINSFLNNKIDNIDTDNIKINNLDVNHRIRESIKYYLSTIFVNNLKKYLSIPVIEKNVVNNFISKIDHSTIINDKFTENIKDIFNDNKKSYGLELLFNNTTLFVFVFNFKENKIFIDVRTKNDSISFNKVINSLTKDFINNKNIKKLFEG